MGANGSKEQVALVNAYWEYARVVLPPARFDHLVDVCRGVGQTAVPGRIPLAAYDGPAFCAVVREGARVEGKHFARRAGFYAGSALARSFVQAHAHPSQSAHRITQVMVGAVPEATLSGAVGPTGTYEVRLESAHPLGAPATEYAAGFVKGAATRLNEGAPPAITERSESGGRVWSALVDFATTAPAEPKGAHRKRRQ